MGNFRWVDLLTGLNGSAERGSGLYPPFRWRETDFVVRTVLHCMLLVISSPSVRLSIVAVRPIPYHVFSLQQTSTWYGTYDALVRTRHKV